MKVLLISRGISGATAGDFRYSGVFTDTFELAKALKHIGIEVIILTPKIYPKHKNRFNLEFGNVLKTLGIKHKFANTFVTYGNDWGFFRLKLFFWELKTIKEYKPNIIQYMQFGPSLLYPFIGNTPLIFYSCYLFDPYPKQEDDHKAKHDNWNSGLNNIQTLIMNLIYFLLAKAIGSMQIKDIVKKKATFAFMHPKGYNKALNLFKDKAKIAFIPKGVSTHRLKEFQTSERSTKVLFIGDVLNGKGIFDLIQAFAEVNKQNPNIQLIIAGTGPIMMLNKLKKRLKTMQINAKYLQSVNYNKKWKLYKNTDVLCLPSYFESYQTVIMEAQACSLPVITTFEIDSPVINGKTGLKVHAGDIKSLTKAIINLINSPNKIKVMSKESYNESLKYDWQKTALKLKQLYAKLQ